MEQRIVIVGGGLAGAAPPKAPGPQDSKGRSRSSPPNASLLPNDLRSRKICSPETGIGDVVIHDVQWCRDNDIELRTDRAPNFDEVIFRGG